MSETIEQVERLRAEGSSVKEACKTAGISMPTYYANRRKLNGSRAHRAKREEIPQPQATNGQYLAILDALRFIHHGDFVSAQAILVEALKV
jgi:hypothetical protein